MTFLRALLLGGCLLGSTALPLALMAAVPGAPAAEEEPKEVIGIEMARPDGRLLGFAIEENRFIVRFYTAERDPEDADVNMATVRWSLPVKSKIERKPLARSGHDPVVLRCPQFVKPPHIFTAYFALLDAQGKLTESYAVDFR